MSDLRTAAQQALEFIKATNASSSFWLVPESNLNKTVKALRAALAQPEQEPGWRLSCGCPSHHGGIPAEWPAATREGDPATAYGVICERHWHEYEAQHPRREWRGLTEEEIVDIWATVSEDYDDQINIIELGRAIEQALKERNHE